ncbi:MAG: thioredoxin domain-containing protein [Polyangiaceae bacterium]
MHAFRSGISRPVGLLFVALCSLLLGASCGTKSDPVPAPVPTVEITSLPGVDTSVLTPRERREWSSQMNELIAPCPDVPVNLATCIRENRACKACLPAAQLMLKLVQNGVAKKDRDELFRGRFDSKFVKTVVTDGSPEKGSPDAAVTIVEWADFECPACQATFPILDGLVERFPGQVRLVYKQYPLKNIHAHAELAAKAAVAAGAQDKFWEMHHKLFSARGKLEQTDIEEYAKQIGLDIARFRADLNAPTTVERIEKDVKQAESLGLTGTPFILINGRETNDIFFNDPEGWVKLDIEMAGQTPAPAPAKSAAPVASDAPAPSGTPVATDAPATSAAPSGTASAGPAPGK